MWQPENTISDVGEPRIPSLSIFGETPNPGMSRSTTNAVTDDDPWSAGAVRMYTTNTSASGPFVIHIFEPFATQPSSVRSARHAIEPSTSEPAPASLIARAPTCWPDNRSGSHLARCSLVPLAQRLCTHRLEWAAYDMPTDADARDSSSMITRCSRNPSPAPPSASATVGPSTPSSPRRGQSQRGKASSRSIASAFDASS